MRGGAVLLVLALIAASCEREERSFDEEPPPQDEIIQSTLAPGGAPPSATNKGQSREYENNAFHISQGKKLFSWFNCVGCHGNGGGGSGPALMDESWFYGSAIENIAASIREGRPNGMPSFRGRVPEQQIWQLAAYVRSLGALAPKDAAAGHNDDMHAAPSENRMIPDPFGPAEAPPTAGPPQAGTPPPPSAVAPQ